VVGEFATYSGSAPELLAPGRTVLTVRGLADQIACVVDALAVRCVARTDRVAIVLPNGPEMASTWVGTG
jgi:hypothetical protein